MKILLFSEEFGNSYTTFIYNEAIELQKRGHQVKYLCCQRTNGKKFNFEDLIVLPFNRNLVSRRLYYLLEKYDIYLSYYNPDFSKKLNIIIDEFSPDVIHCHFGVEALKILDNLKKTNIKVYVTFHGYDASFKLAWKSYINALRRHLSRPNVYAIFVSNYFQEVFKKKSIPVHQSEVIYCGIDVNLFKRKSALNTKDPFVFLQVAGFFDKKGHLATIKAFKLMLTQHPEFNCRLILAGNGPTFDQVQALVKELGLNEKVIFAGLVNNLEAIALMESAHVFVHHSITPWDNDNEGIPTVLMEAMAMELPVITTWHSGLPELVEDGVNGYLVNENDIETYATRMWDSTSWNYLSNNRRVIEKKFELQQHVDKLEKEFSKTPLNTQRFN